MLSRLQGSHILWNASKKWNLAISVVFFQKPAIRRVDCVHLLIFSLSGNLKSIRVSD